MLDFHQARAALQSKRDQEMSLLAGLERDRASSIAAAEAGNADDEHDPEGATIAFERQQVAAHIAVTRDRLRQVDEALARIDAGSYGTCIGCGKPIAPARLRARPAASTCIACADGSIGGAPRAGH